MGKPKFLRIYGWMRRGWKNPLNRRKEKPVLRGSGRVSIPDGAGRINIRDRRRGRKLFE